MNSLRTFRQMHKIDQKELAEVLGTTQQQVSLYETGKRKLNEDQIIRICNKYKISAKEILKIEEGESTMKTISETVLEIGKYIYGKNEKVKMSEIITQFILNDKYPKLGSARHRVNRTNVNGAQRKIQSRGIKHKRNEPVKDK